MLYNGSHTLIWRVILHNVRTTTRSSYLTLKIDSYTTWNMISSIVNVHICFTIILGKRQSPVNTVYLKKDIVGSPLISWLCDNGCIWTYYLLSLLNLRNGSYSMISGNNSQSAYRTLQNESHTLLGGYSMMYRNDSGNINLSVKITPTHHVLRPDRKGMCANLVLGVILWYFEMILGVFIWLRQNKLYGLIDSECRHISHAILRTKTGNPLIINCVISSSVNHTWKISLFSLQRGIYIIKWWNFSKSAHLTLHNDSHILLCCWLHHM